MENSTHLQTITPATTWHVYIIHCSDSTLYTGITTDVDRRFRQHANGSGAKYFRGRKPLQVLYLEKHSNRATATARENVIKAMSKAAKLALIAASPAPFTTTATAA